MTLDAAFTAFPTFSTQRLRLRQIRPDDAEALFAIRSDREVTEQYGQEPYRSLDEAHAMARRVQEHYARREDLFWGITFKDEDLVLGSCTLFHLDLDNHYAEFGYELRRASWRQGIMSEALPPVLSYAFRELSLNRIEANVLANNTASVSLLLKLGFTREGTLRQRALFQGRYIDEQYLGLLRDEWQPAIGETR